MTLEEKVGQLVQITPFQPFDLEGILRQWKAAESAGEAFEFRPALRSNLDDLPLSPSLKGRGNDRGTGVPGSSPSRAGLTGGGIRQTIGRWGGR